jgi:hypothetical protein
VNCELRKDSCAPAMHLSILNSPILNSRATARAMIRAA